MKGAIAVIIQKSSVAAFTLLSLQKKWLGKVKDIKQRERY